MLLVKMTLAEAYKKLRTLYPESPIVRTQSSVFVWMSKAQRWQSLVTTMLDGRVISPDLGENTLSMTDEGFRQWMLPGAVETWGVAI